MELKHFIHDGVVTVSFTGRFTSRDNDDFLPVIADVAARGGRHFVFDFAGLEYMDSFALGLLLLAHEEATKAGNAIRVRGVQPALHHMFELTGMGKVLDIEGLDTPQSPQSNQPRPFRSHAAGAAGRLAAIAVLDGRGEPALRLSGRFTFADIDDFTHSLERLAAPSGSRLTIDLEGVEFMDSAALSSILIAREDSLTRGVDLRLANPRGRIRQLLELTHVGEVVPIDDDPSH
ncbi:MAG: STAS domain-containing protein [Solirubrobacterales bacterium]